MTPLNALWSRGTAFLGTEFAIMAGAMTWVSERHLVSAISNAGGFGVVASQLTHQRLIWVLPFLVLAHSSPSLRIQKLHAPSLNS